MTEHHGPPKEVEGRAPHHQGRPSTHRSRSHHATPTSRNHTAGDAKTPGKALVWLPCTWQFPQDVPSQLNRRREAARRLPRLCDRCGARDPIVCHCWETEPPLSERALDAWCAAIERTLPIGPPIVPMEALRGLYRRNRGSDRELALRVWAATGGLVA